MSKPKHFIPLNEVPDALPLRRRGKKVHVSTIWRWASRGVHGHKLKTWRVGGTTCTTQSAIDEFISATSQRTTPSPRLRQLEDGW